MDLQSLELIFARELQTLRDSILAYPDDASLWFEAPGIKNPGGTLALHLCGNLQHFIGAQLGGTGYTRQRDQEFSRREATRAEIAAEVQKASEAVTQTLKSLDEKALSADFPISFHGGALKTGLFLAHLQSHLAYHLGQLDYHRRIVAKSSAAVSALAFDVFGV